MNSNDKTRYINDWNSHVDALSHLGWGLVTHDDPNLYLELKGIQTRLKELVVLAADNAVHKG